MDQIGKRGKPGGIFECDSCGTEYSTEWARAKIQEIKGTVKVEGTVEVTGTVKLDGPVEVKGGVSVENLLKRGWMALEDGKWLEAQVAFDQVLNLEPENVRAHLGRYLGVIKIHTMAEAEEQYEKYFYVASREGETCPVCRDGKLTEKEEGLFRCPACGNLFDSRKKIAETRRIRQLADAELKQWFARLDAVTEESIRQRIEEARRREEEERIAREKKAEADRIAREKKAEADRIARDKAAKMHAEVSEKIKPVQNLLSGGNRHTVAVKADGTVVGTNYTGDPIFNKGQNNVDGWKNIVAISAGFDHTIGLKADGTVVATKYTGPRDLYHGYCDVASWQNIVAVSAGSCHTVGLTRFGTVVATNFTGGQTFNKGQCDVGDWRNIVAVSANSEHTVGLKSDGTVVAVGNRAEGRCDVTGWKNIVAISAGNKHTVGLRADGTVVVTPPKNKDEKNSGKYDVTHWTDIVAISAGDYHTVGLKADGTVVSTKVNSGFNSSGQDNVTEWKLFQHFDTIQQDKRDAKIASLNSEKATLSTELAGLKGLFTGKRRREIEARLAEIESELKSLS